MAKIMLVDDDRTTVKLLQTLLELEGYEVAAAARGMDVFPIANKFQPDLFLMDYHLNDMRGVDIIRQLRQDAYFANTPIVVASGMDVGDEVMSAGANAFIVKPFEPGDLPVLFNDLLARR
jgi:DNA-binding response OmpR family regulator